MTTPFTKLNIGNLFTIGRTNVMRKTAANEYIDTIHKGLIVGDPGEVNLVDENSYEIRDPKYAKKMKAVIIPGDGSGWKTRLQRLACALSTRYTHRESAYLMSARKATKFEELAKAGWDASVIMGTLEPPRNETPEIVKA